MTCTAFIFPHQLFRDHPVLRCDPQSVFLLEHPLFFGDLRYPMQLHKQKLAYHRASMMVFLEALQAQGIDATLVAYDGGHDPLKALCRSLFDDGCREIVVADMHDDILGRRLGSATSSVGLSLTVLPSPAFINQPQQNKAWRESRKRWHQADFYQWQRKRLDILMSGDKPMGGRWSFDEDNRKKLPKKSVVDLPVLPEISRTDAIELAIKSVLRDFPDNPGTLDHWHYPVSSEEAEQWLQHFLEFRFKDFGPFEDAIVPGENWLYHSVLTPMLNIGLLTPDVIVKRSLAYAKKNKTPLNSVEGFIRQIIGWREFMRASYDDLGVAMRTTNHWQHTRALPSSFYTGTTGIDPVDDVIKRILATGYCHHIERLMILGGFMFLCEFHPDDIYRWFMEMFIDSYDWVMVPNVYAMSQNADGGLITTKPYFSGSNYVLKMSHYKKGEWSEVWDALFWRWIFKQADQLRKNPRWAMMVRNADRMDAEKRELHLQRAERYLAGLAR